MQDKKSEVSTLQFLCVCVQCWQRLPFELWNLLVTPREWTPAGKQVIRVGSLQSGSPPGRAHVSEINYKSVIICTQKEKKAEICENLKNYIKECRTNELKKNSERTNRDTAMHQRLQRRRRRVCHDQWELQESNQSVREREREWELGVPGEARRATVAHFNYEHEAETNCIVD